MRILTLNEFELVAGGRAMTPNMINVPGTGGDGGGVDDSGYYDASDFGGQVSDFFDYGGTACSDFSAYGTDSASNAGFIDYSSASLDTTGVLTGLGAAVGSALSTGISQYGALAATGEAVTADVAAAAAGIGAAYGGGVTIAAVAGWDIGSWVYDKYSVQILDGIDHTVNTVNFVRRHL